MLEKLINYSSWKLEISTDAIFLALRTWNAKPNALPIILQEYERSALPISSGSLLCAMEQRC